MTSRKQGASGVKICTFKSMRKTKYCPSCKTIKTNGEFYRYKCRKDGLGWQCKQCTRAENRRLSKYHTDYIRTRLQDEKFKAEHLRMVLEYQKNNKEKIHAHSAVSRAIVVGKLKKQPCKVCGATRAVAHHEDYSRPLDVVWMCQTHHIRHHFAHLT